MLDQQTFSRAAESLAIIDRAVNEQRVEKVYALFSGGHDSLVTTHVASQHTLFAGVAHINTGIGIEETRDFVRRVCRERGWPLHEYRTPEDYDSLVVAQGFPGPPMHYKMYQRLKDRGVDMLMRSVKDRRSQRIGLITGIRQQESLRRMGYGDPINRRHAQVWVNACFYWSKAEVEVYRESHRLPDNSVVANLGMSGECLCGAYAKPGELARICKHYPDAGRRLIELEARVRAAGHDWGWEGRPPRKRKDARGDIAGAATPQPLCASCDHRNAAEA